MNELEWIVLFGAATGSLGYLFSIAYRLSKTWFKFIEDWNGSEEEPGIVERLKQGDQRFDKIESEIAVIKSELFTNGGSSMRDAINRIEKSTTKPATKKVNPK
jgi:hypothetical protein